MSEEMTREQKAQFYIQSFTELESADKLKHTLELIDRLCEVSPTEPLKLSYEEYMFLKGVLHCLEEEIKAGQV